MTRKKGALYSSLRQPHGKSNHTRCYNATYLIHQVSEGQECNLVEGHGVQEINISLEGLIHVVEKTDCL